MDNNRSLTNANMALGSIPRSWIPGINVHFADYLQRVCQFWLIPTINESIQFSSLANKVFSQSFQICKINSHYYWFFANNNEIEHLSRWIFVNCIFITYLPFIFLFDLKYSCILETAPSFALLDSSISICIPGNSTYLCFFCSALIDISCTAGLLPSTQHSHQFLWPPKLLCAPKSQCIFIYNWVKWCYMYI